MLSRFPLPILSTLNYNSLIYVGPGGLLQHEERCAWEHSSKQQLFSPQSQAWEKGQQRGMSLLPPLVASRDTRPAAEDPGS